MGRKGRKFLQLTYTIARTVGPKSVKAFIASSRVAGTVILGEVQGFGSYTNAPTFSILPPATGLETLASASTGKTGIIKGGGGVGRCVCV